MFIKNIKSVSLIRNGNRCIPDDFSNPNGFYFCRPKKNGKYGYSNILRFCDLDVVDVETEESILEDDMFSIWVRNPFLDVKTNQLFHIPIYEYEIHSPIDSFEENKTIKLIALNSDQGNVIYDGNISNVMFEAETSQTTYTTGSTERCTDECCNLKLIECGWGRCRNDNKDMEFWTTMPGVPGSPNEHIGKYDLFPKNYIPDWWHDWEDNKPEGRTAWEEYYQFQIGNVIFQCRIHEDIGNPDASKDTFGIMFRMISTTAPLDFYQLPEKDNVIPVYYNKELLHNNDHEWMVENDTGMNNALGYHIEGDNITFTEKNKTRLYTIPALNENSLNVYYGNPEMLPVEYFLEHGLDITISSVKCTKVSCDGEGPDVTWEAIPTSEPGIDFRFIVDLNHWWEMLQNIDNDRYRIHYVQHIKIINSNLRNFDVGSFKCTVLKDNTYKPVGGLITIDVNTKKQDIIDHPNQQWIRIPDEYATYRELPDEFILTPNLDISYDKKIKFCFKTEYQKNVQVSISDHKRDPYRYYLNTKNNTKLPISNIRQSDHKARLVVDQTVNQHIKTVQTPYIGICRYSLQDIPKDGYINLTGYIPTPLNRERYEFWVNGRFLREEVHILSPTTIVLCNLKSLKNFEVIELVDDFNKDQNVKNKVMRQGTMYTDLEGNVWSDYRLALLSNSQIVTQDLRYVFNVNQHQKIHDYIPNSMIQSPNNHNWETNILDDVQFSEEDKLDYRYYHNTPTLNGVSLGHVYLSILGIREIPQQQILELYDNHWKKEILTNPLFPTTHRTEINSFLNKELRIVVYGAFHEQQLDGRMIYTNSTGDVLPFDFKPPLDSFIITIRGMTDRFFTLYITDEPDVEIYDELHIRKIIPFIKIGVYVVLPRDQYRGLYVTTTVPNTKQVRLL